VSHKNQVFFRDLYNTAYKRERERERDRKRNREKAYKYLQTSTYVVPKVHTEIFITRENRQYESLLPHELTLV